MEMAIDVGLYGLFFLWLLIIGAKLTGGGIRTLRSASTQQTLRKVLGGVSFSAGLATFIVTLLIAAVVGQYFAQRVEWQSQLPYDLQQVQVPWYSAERIGFATILIMLYGVLLAVVVLRVLVQKCTRISPTSSESDRDDRGASDRDL